MRFLKILGALLLFPVLAQAHPGHQQTFGFSQGLGHPLGGWDHLLAMVAVGVWAWQLGGRSVWLVPLSFVSMMVVGGFLGLMGLGWPGVEHGILLSILLLGLLIIVAARVPAAVGMLLVGVFALFHGYAHGVEKAEFASTGSYVLGFVLATAGLHGVGVLAADRLSRISQPILVRGSGLVIMVAGLVLWIA